MYYLRGGYSRPVPTSVGRTLYIYLYSCVNVIERALELYRAAERNLRKLLVALLAYVETGTSSTRSFKR